MSANYKEIIDNNVADMIRRYSPQKAEPASAQTAAPPAAKPADSPAVGAAKESFFTRLWKSIFK